MNIPEELTPAFVSSIPLWKAMIPLTALIALLAVAVAVYGDTATEGANQISLLLAAAVAAVVGMTLGVPFSKMMEGIKTSIHSALTAILILLVIGSLIGTWVISGIVPAMIYYGLDILNAKVFLGASVIVCSIVSLASGSSWTTMGTVGVALLGIGHALGIDPAYTAGAVISGAYFGDKVSPLSDTTNLASAMAGTELITHIRYMLYTTVPSLVIATGIFFAIGFSSSSDTTITQIEALQNVISDYFYISPILFLVPLAVLVMVMMRVDALMALFVGTLLGAAFAVAFQPKVIDTVSGIVPVAEVASNEAAGADNAAGDLIVPAENERSEPNKNRMLLSLKKAYRAVINTMAGEIAVIPNEYTSIWKSELDELKLAAAREQLKNPELTAEELEALPKGQIRSTSQMIELEAKLAAAKFSESGGMYGMLNTVWLVFCAMSFGGVMEATGLLQRVTQSLLIFARSTWSLIATTATSCLVLNLTASDQYLAIVVPGRMFRKTFEERGLAPQNLSRTLEDAGTVTSVLVPWNTCGAFAGATLGINALEYAPYCFFNWISPLMTIFFAWCGIRIARQ